MRGIRKIECLSKEGIQGLKRLLEGVIFKKDGLGDIILSISNEGEKDYKRRGKANHFGSGFGKEAFIRIKGKEETWWDREIWDKAYDLDNPWGDLSVEEGMRLKRLFKGML